MCVAVILMIAKILEAVSTVAESVKIDSIVTSYVRSRIQPDMALEAVKFDIIIGSYIRSPFIETIVMLSRSVYPLLCIVDL